MKRFLKSVMSFLNKQNNWFKVFFPCTLLLVFLMAILLSHVYTKTYEIEKFDRAKETIYSPITIENEKETERKIRENVQAVQDRYTISEEITTERIAYVNELFEAIDSFNPKDKKDDKEVLSNSEIVLQLNDILSDEITDNLSDIVLLKLVQMNKTDRNEAKAFFIEMLETIFAEGVRSDIKETVLEEMKSQIKYSSIINNDMKATFEKLSNFAVVENSFFDIDKTMEARKSAASNVDPVMIRSGDIIVHEGQVTTKEMYEEMKLVGLLDHSRSINPAIGLFVFILLLVFLLGYELRRLIHRGQLTFNQMLSIFIITFVIVGLMKITSLFGNEINHIYLITPIAFGVLLVRLLVFERISIILALIYAIIASIVFNGQIPGALNYGVFLYFLFFQLIGIYCLKQGKSRFLIPLIGMALSNITIIGMFGLLSIEKYNSLTFFLYASYGLTAAVLSIILTIGVLPFFESVFNILTDNKLLQLANPNQPLIRKILVEAPGTYHHSVMVANLSETACEAIGENGLLARVGSYYHDIGKTIQPHYFIENQVAIQNPHDRISPIKSAKIIINHVIQGEKMLKAHKLPDEIIDICKQHHGTSMVEYFYRIEKKDNPNIDENLFRYPGPKPQNKITGIISICDSVEAAVRSLKEPSTEKIEDIVSAIINHKWMDGQFDETPLTFHELKIVKQSVIESLKGIFHSRIEYPKEEE